MKPEIALYYYPTNVMLVDDNKDFLSTLEQTLKLTSPHTQYSAYSDPHTALKEINEKYNQQSRQHPTTAEPDQDSVSQLILETLNKGSNMKSSVNRSDEISVLVVDLDMPGIDGIEFCRNIKSPNIKKILLTGIATPSRVINAFNNADIHFYVNKSEKNMDALLSEAISRLQYEYFLDISSKVTSDAIVGSAPLFSDPALAEYFKDLWQALKIREFYFQPNPSRYSLELTDGNQALLLVCTDYEIKQHLQVLEEENAPPYFIDSLASGKYIPYFTTADGYYEYGHPDAEYWLTYEADIIQGKQKYFCALLTENIPENSNYALSPIENDSTLH